MTKHRLPLAFLFSATLLTAGEAEAAPAYRLEPEVDGPLLLVGGAVTAGFLFLEEAPSETCARGCDRAKVVFLDRWAAGSYSLPWSTVGDIATGATILFGPLVLTLHEGFRDGMHDNLVVGEAVLLSSALQVLSSYAVPRARPRAYGGEEVPFEDRTNANAARSFFSGHTADAVASVVASARTLQKLGHTRLANLVLGFGLAGSTFVGTARVMSGGHFPTDVLAGGAIGAGFGILMPWMHAMPARLTPMSLPGGGGAMLGGTW
jgi:membrane-associated phospholipid phosphatase